jgi:hypothetical protein
MSGTTCVFEFSDELPMLLGPLILMIFTSQRFVLISRYNMRRPSTLRFVTQKSRLDDEVFSS